MALDLGEGPAFVQVEVRREEGIQELYIAVPFLPEEEPAAEPSMKAPPGKQLAGEPSRVSAGTPAARTPAVGTPAPATLAAGTMAAAGSASSPGGSFVWSVQFPNPYLPGMPPAAAPVKVQAGETLYYVLFGGGGERITETWYDPWGNFIAYFETRFGPAAAGPRVLSLRGKNFNRDYRYESGGNLSECSGEQGLFSAVYGGRGRPLYWKAEREYGLSWDEEGRLTGMRDLGPAPSGEGPFEEPFPAAFRYEYEFDSRGNWILRREIALFLHENLLIPERMWETVRHIDYTGED
jgi:YD repeat-containing protein